MRKKYLSALLFGVLLVTSAGTFTSCKDYDDDINNLQEQVDQQKSLADKLTAVETSIKNLESAQTEANNAVKAAQEAADKAQQAGDSALAAAEEAKLAAAKAQEAAIEAAQKDLNSLKEELVAMINAGDAANSEAIQAVNVEMTTIKGQIEALMAFQSTTEATLKSLTEADAALATQIGELEVKVEENALAIGKLEAAIKAQETALETYKSSNDAEISSLKTELSDLKSKIDDLTSDTGNIAGLTQEIETLKSTVTDLNNKISKINESLAVLYTAVYEGVTGVSFYTGQFVYDNELWNLLNYITLQTSPAVRTWTFGEGDVEEPVKFVKGEKINLEHKVMVRVSPANAVINPENIQIIDTKCNDLVAQGLIKIKEVKAYDDIMTRASVASNGLYNITFELGENYSDEAWKEATKYEENYRNFAVSIKCDYKDAEGNVNVRNVVSEYAMTFKTPEAITMASNLGFNVNDRNVDYIRNRYSSENPEYIWKNGVAVEPIYEGNDMNVIEGDYRTGRSLLPVVANKSFEVQLDDATMETATHFYVVVDYDWVSTNDEDSELIAWKAIEEKTTGINKMYSVAETKGKAEISINYDNLNDAIGFRVFAVNSDGTLVDPDGRSFYVQVGEESQEITGISTNISAITMESDFIPVSIPKVSSYKNETLDTENKINDNITQRNVFTLSYYDANKTVVNINDASSWEKVKFVKVKFDDTKQILDDYAYQGKLTIYGNYGREVASLNITATKKLPTDAPEDFSPKTNQIVNGQYTCYVLPKPEGNSASSGIMNLGNVFNGLDDTNYEFTFAGSKLGANQKVEDLVVKYNTTNGYVLNVDKSFVGKADLHKSTVKYNYGMISYVLNKDGQIENKEHKVNVSIDGATSFNTKYACVYDVQSWSWVNTKAQPINNTLIYGIDNGDNKTLATSKVQGSNSYDNLTYGVTLDNEVHQKYLKYKSIALYSKKNGSINLASKDEYFKPNLDEDTGAITFEFNSQATTPTADVPSVLRIIYTDMFGHDEVIDLDITIKKDK